MTGVSFGVLLQSGDGSSPESGHQLDPRVSVASERVVSPGCATAALKALGRQQTSCDGRSVRGSEVLYRRIHAALGFSL